MITGNKIFSSENIILEDRNFFTNTWQSHYKYTKDDIVNYQGQFWKCKQTFPKLRYAIPGVDYESDRYWEKTEQGRLSMDISCKLYAVATQEQTLSVINNHKINTEKPFACAFESQSELDNGLEISFMFGENISYKTERKYKAHDIKSIGSGELMVV